MTPYFSARTDVVMRGQHRATADGSAWVIVVIDHGEAFTLTHENSYEYTEQLTYKRDVLLRYPKIVDRNLVTYVKDLYGVTKEVAKRCNEPHSYENNYRSSAFEHIVSAVHIYWTNVGNLGPVFRFINENQQKFKDDYYPGQPLAEVILPLLKELVELRQRDVSGEDR